MFEHRKNGACSCAFFFLMALGCPAAVRGANPSLCLSESTGCDEPGSTVNIEVWLGAGDPTIVGVQFKLTFDPNSLTALDILPGSSCDATSPFSTEIHQEIDESTGSIFYAVGINPFKGGTGTNQAAAVACVRFLPRGVSLSEISILVGEEPQATQLSDNFGRLVTVDNSSSCPTGVPGALSTREALVKDMCRCEDDSDCVTLHGDCRVGVCDSSTLLCKIIPINEGAVCDDRNDCTMIDRCLAGVCTGSGCTNPSLCLGESCTPPGSLMVVPVLLGAGDPVITGGQFSIQWDTAGLELVDAQPGSDCDSDSPFTIEVQRVIDAAAGELFYAVGIALGDEGTRGPATMACLIFRVLDREIADVCLFEDINPFLTKLVDDRGQFVDFYSDGACSSEMGYPIIDCELGGFCEIPTTSEWGLVVLGLVFLICAKLRFRLPSQAR